MKSRRNLRGRVRERGAIVLFLVIMIALVSLTIHRLLPVPAQTYHINRLRTVDELNALAFGFRDYYFDKKAFPSSVTDSNLTFKFFNPGLMSSTSAYTGNSNQEQWYNNTNSSWTYRDASGGTSPDYWNIWSVGPNLTNDSAASDDIVRSQYATVAATARTRRLLAIIRMAATYHSATLSSGTWAGSTYRRGSGSSYTPASGCSLGPEFDTDGWGRNFVINTTGRTVYSIGPNETDNSAGSDDITW